MGISSRRKADALIASGRVSVDGKVVTQLGTRVNAQKCKVSIDGVPLDKPPKKWVYYLLNKPRGMVTTLSDPEGRATVKDCFPTRERIFPVGRLDYDSEGVLLMTNDGDLAYCLTHPKFEVKKTYLVKVKGKPDAETLAKLRKGVRLEDGIAKPLHLAIDRTTKQHSWYKIAVAEGRNHLIKRMWLRVGHPVIKLIRTEFGGITLGDLGSGKFRELTPSELKKIRENTRR